MIKVEVIEDFTLEKFDELKNIVRKRTNQEGKLFVGDTFECTKEIADYLIEKNKLNKPFVKVIEIVPEIIAKTEERKSINKTKSKK